MPLIRSVAASDASGKMPTRFVFVIQGNGIEPVNLLSTQARAALASKKIDLGIRRVFSGAYAFSAPYQVPKDQLSTARALGPLRQDGLERQSAVVFGLSNLIAMIDSHSSYYGALACARGHGSPTGQSIDAALAAIPRVRGETPFDAFRAGIHHDATAQTRSGLCAFAAGKPAPLVVEPKAAYNLLFSSVAGGETRRQFEKKRRLLDFAKKSASNSLKVFAGSSIERRKLEDYIASIEDLQARNAGLLDPKFNGRLASVKPAGPEDATPSTSPSFDTVEPLERLQLHFDMATSALLGGLTNVAVLGSGFGGGYGIEYASIQVEGLELEHQGLHPIAHMAYEEESGGLTTKNPYAEYLRLLTQNHVSLITKMANTLAKTPDVDGSTMLDNTLFVFMSDNGDNHHSSGKDWPILLIGGKNMGFQTDGRTIFYPSHTQPEFRQVSNLFNTLGYAAGGQDEPLGSGTTRRRFDYFGAEPDTKRQAPGPLSEIWRA